MGLYSKIDTIYMNRISESHIPYFVAAKVIGVHGGRYIVDEFTLQIMIDNSEYIRNKFRYFGLINYNAVITHAIRNRSVKVVYIKDTKFRNSDDRVRELYRINRKRDMNIKLFIRQNGDNVKSIGRYLII